MCVFMLLKYAPHCVNSRGERGAGRARERLRESAREREREREYETGQLPSYMLCNVIHTHCCAHISQGLTVVHVCVAIAAAAAAAVVVVA